MDVVLATLFHTLIVTMMPMVVTFLTLLLRLHSKKNPSISHKFRVGDANEGVSREVLFDVVCLWDVIEHVHEPKAVFLQVLNSIHNNGYIVMSTPNIGALFAKLLKSRWPFMTPPEHVSFFSKKSMKALVDECGCDIIEWSTKGKWVNIAFAMYKINRVRPDTIPEWFIDKFSKGILSKLNVYAPTYDIQYVVISKKNN